MTIIEIIIPIVAGICAAITHRIGFTNGIKTMEDIVLSSDDLNDLKSMIKAKYNR